MQAGSEMSWNLSGPIFADREDSSPYSALNVITVGIRGCVVPLLGTFLCSAMGPSAVFFIGIGFCFMATWHMLVSRQHGFLYS